MRRRSKTKSMGVILRFTVGLTMGLFVLGLSNAQNAESFDSHKGRCWKAEPVTCGTVLQDGYYALTGNLTCSDNPAIQITGPAKLNLRGYTLSGVSDDNGTNDGIVITGNGAKVWNGTVRQCDNGILIEKGWENAKVWNVTVTQCDNGIRVRGVLNEIIRVEARDNTSRGIRIDGDENLLIKCLAAQNASQGIVIKGNDNKIFSCKVRDNCRDGIEIDGDNNLVFYNRAEDNGNPDTCENFGEEYKPWYYAGIDVTNGSKENEIKGNRACGNLGCFGTDEVQCTACERNFWDENSLNRWEYNKMGCINVAPSCSAAP